MDEGGKESLFFSALARQDFQFIHELVDVFKLAVDRGKPDVGDLIEIVQFFHHFLTDRVAGQFGLAHLLNALFYSIGDGLRSSTR